MSFEIFHRYFYFLTEQRQWDKLWDYLYSVINNPYFLVGLGFIFLTFILGLCGKMVQPGKKIIIFRINVVLYIIGFCLIYLFRQPVDGSGIRETGIGYYLTLNGYHESLVITSIAHALLYIPFGYWLTRGFKKHWLLRPLILVVVIVGVEILQLVMGRGYLAVQDLVTDTVGGIIGAIPAGIVNIVEDRKSSRRRSS